MSSALSSFEGNKRHRPVASSRHFLDPLVNPASHSISLSPIFFLSSAAAQNESWADWRKLGRFGRPKRRNPRRGSRSQRDRFKSGKGALDSLQGTLLRRNAPAQGTDTPGQRRDASRRRRRWRGRQQDIRRHRRRKGPCTDEACSLERVGDERAHRQGLLSGAAGDDEVVGVEHCAQPKPMALKRNKEKEYMRSTRRRNICEC
jgi:hypothetical protein